MLFFFSVAAHAIEMITEIENSQRKNLNTDAQNLENEVTYTVIETKLATNEASPENKLQDVVQRFIYPTLPQELLDTNDPVVIENPDTPMSRSMTMSSSSQQLEEDTESGIPGFPRTEAEERNASASAHEVANSFKGLTINAENKEAAVETSQFSEKVANAPPQSQTIEVPKSHFPVADLENEKLIQISLKPLTIPELLELYYNPQLAYNERFIDDFIQVIMN